MSVRLLGHPDPDPSSIYADCACHCGDGIEIKVFVDADDDDFCFMSTRASVFYMKQDGIINTIKSRLKAAWYMLRGKEYCLHEIVLTLAEYKHLVELMNNMLEEHEELCKKD